MMSSQLCAVYPRRVQSHGTVRKTKEDTTAKVPKGITRPENKTDEDRYWNGILDRVLTGENIAQVTQKPPKLRSRDNIVSGVLKFFEKRNRRLNSVPEKPRRPSAFTMYSCHDDVSFNYDYANGAPQHQQQSSGAATAGYSNSSAGYPHPYHNLYSNSKKMADQSTMTTFEESYLLSVRRRTFSDLRVPYVSPTPVSRPGVAVHGDPLLNCGRENRGDQAARLFGSRPERKTGTDGAGPTAKKRIVSDVTSTPLLLGVSDSDGEEETTSSIPKDYGKSAFDAAPTIQKNVHRETRTHPQRQPTSHRPPPQYHHSSTVPFDVKPECVDLSDDEVQYCGQQFGDPRHPDRKPFEQSDSASCWARQSAAPAPDISFPLTDSRPSGQQLARALVSDTGEDDVYRANITARPYVDSILNETAALRHRPSRVARQILSGDFWNSLPPSTNPVQYQPTSYQSTTNFAPETSAAPFAATAAATVSSDWRMFAGGDEKPLAHQPSPSPPVSNEQEPQPAVVNQNQGYINPAYARFFDQIQPSELQALECSSTTVTFDDATTTMRKDRGRPKIKNYGDYDQLMNLRNAVNHKMISEKDAQKVQDRIGISDIGKPLEVLLDEMEKKRQARKVIGGVDFDKYPQPVGNVNNLPATGAVSSNKDSNEGTAGEKANVAATAASDTSCQQNAAGKNPDAEMLLTGQRPARDLSPSSKRLRKTLGLPLPSTTTRSEKRRKLNEPPKESGVRLPHQREQKTVSQNILELFQ